MNKAKVVRCNHIFEQFFPIDNFNNQSERCEVCGKIKKRKINKSKRES